jgi:adenosylcobinamide-GDP ribazoletransferase
MRGAAKPNCPAWAPPLLAIQFLTRVPVPAVSRLSESAVKVGLGRAAGWFPLIGALVGLVTAATLLLADQFWPLLVAVLLALIVEARFTGAFHEDAVADFCDGVGGGRDPAHVRQIMKDSRIGTFGALGLTLGLTLRAALMYSLAAMSAGAAGGALAAGSPGTVSGTLATDSAGAVSSSLGADSLGAGTGMFATDAIIVAFAIIAAATFGRLLAVVAMVVTPPASALAPPASPLAPAASSLAPAASSLASPASPLAPAASSLASPASPLAPAASSLAPAASSLAPAASSLAPAASSLAHSTGRSVAAASSSVVAVSSSSPSTPATSSALGKDVTAGIRSRDVVLAFVTSLPGLIPFALHAPLALLAACAAALVFLIWFRALVIRRVGGSTGDCLGFVTYAGQLFVLMAATAS